MGVEVATQDRGFMRCGTAGPGQGTGPHQRLARTHSRVMEIKSKQGIFKSYIVHSNNLLKFTNSLWIANVC
jgi:hypothetical protein